jgi:hypothetical protein
MPEFSIIGSVSQLVTVWWVIGSIWFNEYIHNKTNYGALLMTYGCLPVGDTALGERWPSL